MGMGIAPNTLIHNLVGYNTHTHTQNIQLFFRHLDEIFFYFTKNQFYLKKNIYSYLNEIITF